ncbi:V-type proton ATPase 116 kDa subunit [Schistosoma japonicum]|nr:V-type proton ATPase 116 kDa subunit [Schistosoma japonicum]
MGSLFRSEEMQLSQMFLHTDIAYMCISELGELGLVQFRDTVPGTNAFQRKFVNEVRRCDEMERKLRFLEKEIAKDKFPILDTGENPEAPAPREIIDLESIFEKLENELKEVNSSAEKLKKTYLELSELKQILRKTQTFFDEALHDPSMSEENIGLLGGEGIGATGATGGLRLGFLAGIILRERLPAFERMLWRVCRGNVFLKQAEVDDPLEDFTTSIPVHKSVFLVFFQGDQLRTRVKKICDGFHATLYPCPDSQADRRNMAIEVMGQIQDLETVLTQTKQHRQRILETAAKNLRIWFIRVRKIKGIYHTLNLFNLDVTTKCMVGECWCAVNDVDKINLALRRGMERSNSTLQPILNGIVTTENPPTYHRTNKFTYAFQSIIDAYGVARYREVNPALFTIITFPFLFAVMFGDAGHGMLMFLFALWMVVCERKLSANKSGGEIWNIFFNGRYIMLLMGLFSIYTGLIYNDIFSLSANIFGSSWYPTYDSSALSKDTTLQLEPRTSVNVSDRMYAGYPYPFGLDPVWQLSVNKISLTNSIKMKMSVVLGVLHMLLGISLGAFNYRNNKDNLSIWCLLLPQILFLSCIFLYLVVLIFFKWVAYTAETASSAPSLLIGLINMIRFSYPDEIPSLYSGQKAVQSLLMVIVVICVPWMLLSKPLILYMRHRAIMKARGPINHPDVSTKSSDKIALDGSGLGDTNGVGSMDMPVESFDFGDIMVHQSIHTIEFCLGCISNTASYLRLWALSLAHAQLSEVLWSMVMRMGLSISGLYGGVVLAFIFAFWAILTVSILLCMEGLSAFLHTLRLHWVEFQNKFYSGDGYPFVPFSFDHSNILTDN